MSVGVGELPVRVVAGELKACVVKRVILQSGISRRGRGSVGCSFVGVFRVSANRMESYR